ncbi:hypothetical protein GCM10023178_12840 [Actinomadura luteofluorescens]
MRHIPGDQDGAAVGGARDNPALHLAGGGEGVVDGPVAAQVAVQLAGTRGTGTGQAGARVGRANRPDRRVSLSGTTR